ncbi:kinase-like domain-containing protein [Fennellomyces sp. T-0311]|nr:kinase-like domain-containing protein [Fennellomyces sp. T-0311]
MPCTADHEPRLISVFETTLSIQQDVLSVFNVVIQTPSSIVSLVRYPFDFVEFHQKIRMHYPRSSKIPFPALSTPVIHRLTRRRSIKNLLTFSKKSNADKIEKYLQRCFDHPIVSISTLLRDFLSVQREEDKLLPCNEKPSTDTKPIKPIKKTIHPVSVDDYELLKVLGKGCMGKVLLVKSRMDKQLYALKAIQKDHVIQQKEVLHTRAERDILARLRDEPFLVRLYYAFQTPHHLFLVLDYYSGGDIATQMSKFTTFSEERTLFYAAEILHGLSTLHKHGIIYRDLKPENVLIGRHGHIVLTDFGLSKVFDVQADGDMPITRTFCGTAEYLAPEVLMDEPYTYVVDYWSLGTLLYEMLAGVTPFWAETHMAMYRRVLDDPLEFPPHFDAVTCDFLAGLLERDPCERLGWDGVESIQNHPFFGSIQWDDVANLKLTPPYIPDLSSETDLTNFDETFVNMTPKISQMSSQEPVLEDDPFEGFSFDPRRNPPATTHEHPTPPPRLLRQKLQRTRAQQKKLGKDRFSSSSSLLSFTPGEVIRHTDTMPSFLQQRYARKRHSAALSAQHMDYLLAASSKDAVATKKPAATDTSSLCSSMTLSSNPDHDSDNTSDDRLCPASSSSKPVDHSPYTRPHCPVPGQIRPDISLASNSTATTPMNQRDSMCLEYHEQTNSNTSNPEWQPYVSMA